MVTAETRRLTGIEPGGLSSANSGAAASAAGLILGTAARLIRQLNDTLGLTSIMVSHDLDTAFAVADHMVVLANGRVAVQGTPDEVRRCPDPLVQQFITAAPEGPVHFHYAAPAVAEDYGPEAAR